MNNEAFIDQYNTTTSKFSEELIWNWHYTCSGKFDFGEYATGVWSVRT